ncbi:MAG TPA: VOC family protein [Gemmatimonadales bacterium]|jgi:catechol 2,3-dioxygenase-like lactoylglutathione lyase family enzyme
MQVSLVIPQLRTTDLDRSIRFYTEQLGFALHFRHADFYAGIRAGTQRFDLKLVDEPDPSIAWVAEGDHFHLYIGTSDVRAVAEELKGRGVVLVREVHDTAWGTREFVIRDDQGHTLYFGEPVG